MKGKYVLKYWILVCMCVCVCLIVGVHNTSQNTLKFYPFNDSVCFFFLLKRKTNEFWLVLLFVSMREKKMRDGKRKSKRKSGLNAMAARWYRQKWDKWIEWE